MTTMIENMVGHNVSVSVMGKGEHCKAIALKVEGNLEENDTEIYDYRYNVNKQIWFDNEAILNSDTDLNHIIVRL